MEDRTAPPVTLVPPVKPPGKCLWCGGYLTFWKELEDTGLQLYSKPVAYSRCESCDSLSQCEPLSSRQLGQAYSDSYWVEGGNDSPLRRLAVWYQQKILSLDQGLFLCRVLDTLKGKRILEIGPGRGDFLVWARGRGAIVTGWERSAQAVSSLRAKGLEAESVILEDLSLWPVSGETWDVIVGFHVLEHLVDPVKIVAGLISRLAPNGLLIFQVPRIDSWQARMLNQRWIGLDAPRHVSIPSLKGLRKLASSCGLEEQAFKHFSLRDNSFHIFASFFPSLDPHRPGFGGLKMMQLLLGTWCLQPLALLEAFAGKGGTVMMAFQKKTTPSNTNLCQ